MKFNLKTSVVFSKEFEIEAEHHPSIREYNIKMCKEKIARQCGTQQS